MRRFGPIWLLVSLLAGVSHAQTLQPGDPAPEFLVSDVVKGRPITRLDRGRVYVIDFWATWCEPCRKAMPELTQLQCEYGPRGVEVIGVHVMDDPSNVGAFLVGRGDYPEGDRMMEYTVAVEAPIDGKDPRRGGWMTEQWLRATGRSEIPTAFIIDREGDIAWIGHPSWPTGELEDYLSHVVDGTLTERTRVSLEARWARIGGLSRKVRVLAQTGEFEAALEAMDELEQLDPRSKRDLAIARFEILLVGLREPERAYAFAQQAAATSLRDSAWNLNVIAWMIVDEPTVDTRDYDLAIKLAERACVLTGWKDPAILDTLAKAYYDSGSRMRGLALQEAALRYASGTKWEPELSERLERYQRELGAR